MRDRPRSSYRFSRRSPRGTRHPQSSLSEYAPDRVRRVIKPALEILAGIPTIVYGYFALSFVTPLLQKIMPDLLIFNALSAGIVMGLMIIPMVSSLSEDAMLAVPRSLRHAAYALRRNPSWK